MPKKMQKSFKGGKLPRGIYIPKNGKTYAYGFKDEKTGKYIRKVTDTNDVRLAVKIRDLARNEFILYGKGLEKKRIKLSALFKDYIDRYAKLRKTNWRIDRTILNRFLGYFGDIYLQDLQLTKLLDYRSWRSVHTDKIGKNGTCFVTANRDMACLRKAINFAVEYHELDYLNPFIKYRGQLKFPSEVSRQRIRYLSLEEKTRLFSALPESHRGLVFFAISLGMRQNEIMKAQWRDIDWEQSHIKVISRKGRNGEIKIRFINFDIKVREFLKRLPKVSEFIFGYKGFKTNQNLWWHYRERWLLALDKAHIENLTFHDLRHTFATYSLQKGATLPTLKEILGHSNISMTNRYAHVSNEQKIEAAAMVAEMLADIKLMDSCHSDVTHKLQNINIANIDMKSQLEGC